MLSIALKCLTITLGCGKQERAMQPLAPHELDRQEVLAVVASSEDLWAQGSHRLAPS
jgi:hypothetical protein